jgi:hypothetical protein
MKNLKTARFKEFSVFCFDAAQVIYHLANLVDFASLL